MLTYLALIWGHFIGDFILQSEKMSLEKIRSVVTLLEHSFLYSILLIIVGIFIPITPIWVLVNGILHFIVDYIVNKIVPYVWDNGNSYMFFCIVSIDQLIHITSIFMTYEILVI